MNFWNAMVAMLAILAFAAMRIARYKAGLGDRPSRRSSLGASVDALASFRESELRGEIDKLRQRVAVLERIATEDRHSKSVAAEIESLRDR